MTCKNSLTVLLFVVGLVFQGARAQAQTAPPSAPPTTPAAQPDKPAISPAEIETLVAPIALYPDSLVSQILMASTYPLEIVQAARYAKDNKLTGDALAKDLEKQTWDPSVKSLVNFPQVLTMMNEKLDSTIKLGDAFLTDQKAVLDAVQKLRGKARAQGNLESGKEQTIIVEQAPETKVEVIRIESPDPQVVYVPTYNPTVVYGTWPYPASPPYYYTPPGYVAAGLIGFGTGLALGAAWGHAWGDCDWHGGNVNVDVNRNANFNRNIDRSKYQNRINNLPANNRGGQNSFRHDPSHRQGVAYRDQKTNQRFGGASNNAIQSREAYRGRAEAGRADINRGGASDFRGTGGRTPSASDWSRGGSPSASDRSRGGGSGVSRSGSNGLGNVGSSGSSTRSASQRGSASRASSSPSRSSGGGVSRGGGGGGASRGGGGGGGRGGGGGGGRR